MEWNFTAEEKQQLRKYLVKQYPGPVFDEAADLRQNLRAAWRARDFFTAKKGDFCFLDLLLAAARRRLLSHGMMPPSAKSPLLMRIVLEMLARAEEGKAEDPEPSYLLNAPSSGQAAPVERRRMEAGFRGERGIFGYSDGFGAMVIMGGLSAAEVAEHVTGLAGTNADSVFVIDVAKVLRTIITKLRERGQPIPGEEPKP
jgi:hypothetical protein